MNKVWQKWMMAGWLLSSVWGTAEAAEPVRSKTIPELAKKFITEGVALGRPCSSMEPHYFQAETVYKTVNAAGSGDETGRNTLFLECVPFMEGKIRKERYTCQGFVLSQTGKSSVTIPSLVGLTYVLQIGEDGNINGLDQGAFTDVKDSNGAPLALMDTYTVYCAFIDFFALCYGVTRENPRGIGGTVADLKKIGGEVVHFASHAKTGAPLEGNAPQMDFIGGEGKVRLDGFGMARDRLCALVKFDAGYSKVENHSKMSPTSNLDVLGTSLFRGMIWIDPETQWVEQGEWEEIVNCVATLSGHSEKTLVHREGKVQSLSFEELAQRLKEQLGK